MKTFPIGGVHPSDNKLSRAVAVERFALPVRKPVRELSRGMKMKLSLAAALAHRPRLLVLDEALDALSKGLVDEALVDRALDMSARGVEVALTGRAPSRKIVEKADYISEMRCEKHPYSQGICAREGVEY